jgi:hypothetical protein
LYSYDLYAICRGAFHSKNPVHFVKKSGKNPNKSGKSKQIQKNPTDFLFKNPLKNPGKSAKKSADF